MEALGTLKNQEIVHRSFINSIIPFGRNGVLWCYYLYPRIKDMSSFEIPEHQVIVTASSDGFIKMWKLQQDKVSVLAQYKYTLKQVLISILL